jgi:hypothetical protein
MFINKKSGTIELPNGLVITSQLDKPGFEDSVYFRQATPYDHGTLPFQWFRLEGGQLDGHILRVNICFYSDVLVDFHLSANLYPLDETKWEGPTLEVERQTKMFHDHILLQCLGKPHRRISLPSGLGDPVLDTHVEYKYRWGIVWSGYDARSGSASVGLSYGSRLKEAQEEYRRKKGPVL